MRILVLTTDAFGGHGGIAKYNRDFLTALCSAPGVDEVVALPRLAPHPLEPLPPRLTFDRSSLGGKGRFVMATARRLIARDRFTLIICGHINLLSAAFAARLRHRTPLHLLTYGIEVWQPPPKVLASALVRRLDGAIAISEVTSDRFRRWAPIDRSAVSIMPNALDAETLAGGNPDVIRERHGLGGRTVLMTLGRMLASERMKGFDELIDIFPRLKRAIPSLSYLFVGDGDDRARLQAKAMATGSGSDIVFTGNVPENEKAAHYRAADVFAMPSRGEGFGFVFLEAMACGVPVVASRIDGGREALRNGQLGVLVDPTNLDEIEQGILTALQRPRGVPGGLRHFSFANFERRVHDWVATAARGTA